MLIAAVAYLLKASNTPRSISSIKKKNQRSLARHYLYIVIYVRQAILYITRQTVPSKDCKQRIVCIGQMFRKEQSLKALDHMVSGISWWFSNGPTLISEQNLEYSRLKQYQLCDDHWVVFFSKFQDEVNKFQNNGDNKKLFSRAIDYRFILVIHVVSESAQLKMRLC